MNDENLIPLSKRGQRDIQRITSMGGSVCSNKKKYASKIREMKKRRLTDDDVNWFLERIEDPDISIFHLQQWIDQLRDNIPIERQRTLIDTAINLHKAHHGEKTKNGNINININIDMLKFKEKAEEYSKK